MSRSADALGVVLAGGGNRRYGSHKAFARVGERTVVSQVIDALTCICEDVVIVANDPDVYGELGLPLRPDVESGLGALGGIRTAIAWAAETGRAQAILLACDMPFVPAGLLRALAERGDRGCVSVPASPGRRGLEPLCAAYGVDCLAAVERALAEGDRAVISFFPSVEVRILAEADVAAHGDPEHMFLNINRPADRERAERLLEGLDGGEEC